MLDLSVLKLRQSSGCVPIVHLPTARLSDPLTTRPMHTCTKTADWRRKISEIRNAADSSDIILHRLESTKLTDKRFVLLPWATRQIFLNMAPCAQPLKPAKPDRQAVKMLLRSSSAATPCTRLREPSRSFRRASTRDHSRARALRSRAPPPPAHPTRSHQVQSHIHPPTH